MFGTSTLLTKVHLEFILAIEAAIIVNDYLDYCGHINNSSHFCNIYYSMIVEKKISKFGFANYINVLPYQKYLDVFNDLTLIKEIFITCAYLIISIIKLKSSRTDLTTCYHWI